MLRRGQVPANPGTALPETGLREGADSTKGKKHPAQCFLLCPFPSNSAPVPPTWLLVQAAPFSWKGHYWQSGFFPQDLRKWRHLGKIQINNSFFKINAAHLARTQQPFPFSTVPGLERGWFLAERGTFFTLNPTVLTKDCFVIPSRLSSPAKTKDHPSLHENV